MNRLSTFPLLHGYAPAPALRPVQVCGLIGRRPLQIIGKWIARSRQRRALAALDDRLLDDVGITRSAAAREIAKPFWR